MRTLASGTPGGRYPPSVNARSPRGRVLDWSTAVAGGLLATAALYHVLAFVVIASQRLRYPYQLEWMEGGSLDHVRRILAGHSLYAEPALDFIAFIYTPLYFYVGAAVSRFTGAGLSSLRAVSMLCTVASLGLIGLWVHRECKQLLPSLFAAGLFAGSWWIAGAWFDLARVDSLFLLLTLAAAFLLRFHARDTLPRILAGLLIVAAYQTKQAALMVFAPALLYELLARRNWVTVAVAGIAGALSLGLLQWTSSGWYWFYTVTLPATHEILPGMFVVFWRDDLLAHVPLGLALAAGWLLVGRPGDGSRGRWFYIALAAGMFGAACASRMHAGGDVNVNMPALAMLAILSGLAVGALRDWGGHLAGPRSAVAAGGVLYLACVIQLGSLYRSPTQLLPTAEDRAAGRELSRLIAGYRGEVLVPYHGYLAARVGKPAFAHAMAGYDLHRSGTEHAHAWSEALLEAFASRRFDAVIVDSHLGMFPFLDTLAESYQVARELYAGQDEAFWPISGMRTRPWRVYEGD